MHSPPPTPATRSKTTRSAVAGLPHHAARQLFAAQPEAKDAVSQDQHHGIKRSFQVAGLATPRRTPAKQRFIDAAAAAAAAEAGAECNKDAAPGQAGASTQTEGHATSARGRATMIVENGTAKILFPSTVTEPPASETRDRDVTTSRKNRPRRTLSRDKAFEVFADPAPADPFHDDPDNPFAPCSSKSKSSSATQTSRPDASTGGDVGRSDAPSSEQQDGLFYVFRGKRIFRKFESPEDAQQNALALESSRKKLFAREIEASRRRLLPPHESLEDVDLDDDDTSESSDSSESPVSQPQIPTARRLF
ncbi:hypothetical protein PYCC9005_005829 [Savitreella phatthalungensis]